MSNDANTVYADERKKTFKTHRDVFFLFAVNHNVHTYKYKNTLENRKLIGLKCIYVPVYLRVRHGDASDRVCVFAVTYFGIIIIFLWPSCIGFRRRNKSANKPERAEIFLTAGGCFTLNYKNKKKSFHSFGFHTLFGKLQEKYRKKYKKTIVSTIYRHWFNKAPRFMISSKRYDFDLKELWI